jgi:hypothetical protein
MGIKSGLVIYCQQLSFSLTIPDHLVTIPDYFMTTS